VSILVKDYDEAIAFYVGVLGFALIEDTPIPKQRKRWVVVAPNGTSGAQILLAKASNDQQVPLIGNQTGGRVFLFLYTDDFERDFAEYQSRGVKFVRGKVQEPYGTVAVFLDLYGNQWDLIELVNSPRHSDPCLLQTS
jgi:catechol 2,3-dioxygenase-like lactoylglutathione lyase family enzyme